MRLAFHLHSTPERLSVGTHVNTRIQQLSEMFLYYVRLRQQNIYPPAKQISPISCGCKCDMIEWRDACRENFPLHEMVFCDIQIMWCVGVCVYFTLHIILCSVTIQQNGRLCLRLGYAIRNSFPLLSDGCMLKRKMSRFYYAIYSVFLNIKKLNSNSKMLFVRKFNPQAV